MKVSIGLYYYEPTYSDTNVSRIISKSFNIYSFLNYQNAASAENFFNHEIKPINRLLFDSDYHFGAYFIRDTLSILNNKFLLAVFQRYYQSWGAQFVIALLKKDNRNLVLYDILNKFFYGYAKIYNFSKVSNESYIISMKVAYLDDGSEIDHFNLLHYKYPNIVTVLFGRTDTSYINLGDKEMEIKYIPEIDTINSSITLNTFRREKFSKKDFQFIAKDVYMYKKILK